jgi:hypothetical protein
VDLLAFGGSALLSVAMLGVGQATHVLSGATPGWAWVPAVLFVDVAHVWSTAFRTYFDGKERARRPVLYTAVPAGCFVLAYAVCHVSEHLFWQALAYLAIIHFVRQQAGWVLLYRARAKEPRGTVTHMLDTAAIYAATLGPLAYWHAHLPRRFDWFVPGDIVPLPAWTFWPVAGLSVLALAAWAAHTCIMHMTRRAPANPGKVLLIVTTALTWTLGIVVFDSDYAFTMTNVFAHGIPYVCLVFFYQRRVEEVRGEPRSLLMKSIFAFGSVLFFLAYAEELLWDRGIYHERPWLFGESWDDGGSLRGLLVPLLALPQLTHYVLDGFIWRRARNPMLSRMWDSGNGNAQLPP